MSGSVVGLVLAAGEGTRLGMPKALVAGFDGTPWLVRAVGALAAGGVDPVYVVVGAEADKVRAVAPEGARIVEADDWREGMGASLRAGLRAVADGWPDADAVVVALVDTPGVGAEVIRRIAAYAAPDALVRATYGGAPGHPVLFGRAHWEGVIESAHGDRGAREYTASHGCLEIDAADLGDGADIDTPAALDEWRERG